MSLDTVWLVIVAFFWCGFFVLEGFDFGVGLLHRLVGRTEIERRVAVNTIGPLWDGNEVWLIIAGATVFAAFPSWYATWFSAGYLALFLVIVALIFRGLSFEWRGKIEHAHWLAWWSWGLTICSLLIPTLIGVALGDLLAGLPVDSSNDFTGNFFDLLTPYGLVTGVTLLVLCWLHGATFLSLRTDGAIRDRAHRWARVMSWLAVVVVVAQGVWTGSLGGGGAWRWLTIAVPVVGSTAAVWFIHRRREGRAFAATAITIGGVVAALFANLYPNVLVSSSNVANNLTVANASSNDYALKVMTIVALIATPIALGYQAWSYYVFRARIKTPGDSNQTEKLGLNH